MRKPQNPPEYVDQVLLKSIKRRTPAKYLIERMKKLNITDDQTIKSVWRLLEQGKVTINFDASVSPRKEKHEKQ